MYRVNIIMGGKSPAVIVYKTNSSNPTPAIDAGEEIYRHSTTFGSASPWSALQEAMIEIAAEHSQLKRCPHDYLTEEAQRKLAQLRDFMGE